MNLERCRMNLINQNHTKKMKRREFAEDVFPHLRPHAAVECLRRAIEGDSLLYRALMRTGYKKHSHHLTSRQVAVLRYYLC